MYSSSDSKVPGLNLQQPQYHLQMTIINFWKHATQNRHTVRMKILGTKVVLELKIYLFQKLHLVSLTHPAELAGVLESLTSVSFPAESGILAVRIPNSESGNIFLQYFIVFL